MQFCILRVSGAHESTQSLVPSSNARGCVPTTLLRVGTSKHTSAKNSTGRREAPVEAVSVTARIHIRPTRDVQAQTCRRKIQKRQCRTSKTNQIQRKSRIQAKFKSNESQRIQAKFKSKESHRFKAKFKPKDPKTEIPSQT